MTPTHSVSGTPLIQKATIALTSGLTEYFESTCPSRYNLRIPVKNVESEVGTGMSQCTLHLGLPGALVVQARADVIKSHFLCKSALREVRLGSHHWLSFG